MNSLDARVELQKGHLRGKLIAALVDVTTDARHDSLILLDELVDSCEASIREREELAAVAYTSVSMSCNGSVEPTPPPSEE